MMNAEAVTAEKPKKKNSSRWGWREWIGYLIYLAVATALFFAALLWMTKKENWYAGDHNYEQIMQNEK